jgi:2,5-diketo-D-gluconate reductase A
LLSGLRVRVSGGLGRGHAFTHPVLSEVAEKHGKSVAQVVLHWLIQREVVAIPKSVRAGRMAENIDVFDFELTDDQMASIATLDTGCSLFFDHRDPAVVSRLGTFRLSD